MKKIKQKLGPAQLKWVKALESGKFEQTKYKLFDPVTKGFCCLGVFEHVVCGVPTKQLAKKEVLLPGTSTKYGFRSKSGRIFAKGEDFWATLAELNDGETSDNRKWSFTRIAKYVRDYPERVFKKAV